jgi:5-methylcytosine-specific restriction endonuclease McrA
LKPSRSELEITQDFLTWVGPYAAGSKGGSIEILRNICEREELLFLAQHHFVGSDNELRNVLARDAGIAADSEQSKYLVGRWRKLFGASLIEQRPSVRELQERDGVGCQYCLLRSSRFEVHHVIPQEKHGKDSPFNLVLTCPACNKRISNNIVIPRNWWFLHPESRFHAL